MYFDTHAHYDDAQFDQDRDEALAQAAAEGVRYIVDPAVDLASCDKVRSIAERHEGVYFAAGVHPEQADEAEAAFIDRLRPYLEHPKNVAVGEIGLDYHWRCDNKPRQREILTAQLELARETGKPVIIHERDATADWLGIFREYRDLRGVMHCFSGSRETAKTVLDAGWYISFTGVVTFKNARRVLETAAWMPLDRLMLETDSPYMAPEPNRGRRNSSLNLKYICRRLAQLRSMEPEELARITLENGKRFYNIAQ